MKTCVLGEVQEAKTALENKSFSASAGPENGARPAKLAQVARPGESYAFNKEAPFKWIISHPNMASGVNILFEALCDHHNREQQIRTMYTIRLEPMRRYPASVHRTHWDFHMHDISGIHYPFRNNMKRRQDGKVST